MLQFGGGGGNSFFDDLAAGFKAGFDQNDASTETSDGLQKDAQPVQTEPEALKRAAADAEAAAIRRQKILAAKQAREAAAAAGGDSQEPKEQQQENGRTTLSAEEGAQLFASMAQPRVLSAEEAEAMDKPVSPPPSTPAEASPATFGWANTETSPEEMKAAQLRSLKSEAAAKPADGSQGGRILSADEEKALFASSQEKSSGFGLAVPSADQIQSYVPSLAETASAAAPEPAQVQAAAEAKAAKERQLAKSMETPAGKKSWWSQALEAGGKIAQASAEAVSDANAKKRNESVQSPVDPLKSMLKKGSKASLYRRLDKAIDSGDFDAAAAIKAEIDRL